MDRLNSLRSFYSASLEYDPDLLLWTMPYPQCTTEQQRNKSLSDTLERLFADVATNASLPQGFELKPTRDVFDARDKTFGPAFSVTVLPKQQSSAQSSPRGELASPGSRGHVINVSEQVSGSEYQFDYRLTDGDAAARLIHQALHPLYMGYMQYCASSTDNWRAVECRIITHSSTLCTRT